MGQEEQDAIFGRLMRENKEANVKLVAMKKRAEELGTRFAQLGEMLRNDPGAVSFGNQLASVQRVRLVYDRAHFNIEEVVKLVVEIHETETEINQNQNQLRAAGFTA